MSVQSVESRREWLILRRGYWYRPDRAGYTRLKAAAGRYTEEEAKREAAIEPAIMQAVHQDKVPDDDAPRLIGITSQEARDAIVAAAVRNVCELCGYDSPDDRPDLVQCTVGQLELCVRRALGEDV